VARRVDVFPDPDVARVAASRLARIGSSSDWKARWAASANESSPVSAAALTSTNAVALCKFPNTTALGSPCRYGQSEVVDPHRHTLVGLRLQVGTSHRDGRASRAVGCRRRRTSG
jgi:hypothetical protein